MKKLTTLLILLFAVIALSATLTSCLCAHEWEEATCTERKVCKICRLTVGDAPGHVWKDATCTEPQTCDTCGLTAEPEKGHIVENWEIITESTCAAFGEKTGICTSCNEAITESVEKLEHTLGEWTIIEKASLDIGGTKTQSCTACSEVVNTEKYYLSGEEREQLYKKECKKYSYNEISRNPQNYYGERAVFTGEVIQVLRENKYGTTEYTLRVNVTKEKYMYTDTLYVTYSKPTDQGYILEDDIITMYGKLDGEKTYETIFGGSVTIPAFKAEYIDIK